jgi:predicted transcriptional regulator
MPRKKAGHDSLTVQIPESLARRVRQLAKEEGRHLSKMVEILIMDGLSKREYMAQGKLFNSVHDAHAGDV